MASLRMTYVRQRSDSQIRQFVMRLPKAAQRARGQVAKIVFDPGDKQAPIILDVRIGDVVKFSLRTTDDAVARQRDAQARAQLERYFRAASADPSKLTNQQRHALAGAVYRLYVETHGADPGSAARWAAFKAFTRATAEGRIDDAPAANVSGIDADAIAYERFGDDLTPGIDALPRGESAAGLERRFGDLCDWTLAQHGLSISQEDRRLLLDAIAQAAHDAGKRLKRNASGDYTPDPNEQRFPKFERIKSLSFQEMFDRWAKEAKPSASTISSWRSPLVSLRKHVGHDDARRVSESDAIGWKDALVASGLSPKTIKDGHVAALKSIWSYGLANKLVTFNPFKDVKVATRKRAGSGRLPYENAEVARLLRIARAETDAGRRWLPWLAAFTGARIGELAQAWGKNVENIDGIPVLHIRPADDGGTLKNEPSERTIPIHSALIAEGFLSFAEAKGEGPLFYGKARGQAGSRHASKGVTNRLASWIRAQGFDDPRKAPAHAMRHWFKSAGHEAGAPDSAIDFIQGHAIKSTAGVYRHFSLKALREALERIQVEVEGTTTPDGAK